MEKRHFNNRNSGFSVVEMLAVVAILVILFGVSMVSAARYRDLLKITELDNAARSIYMAAENRAVLLSGGKRLKNQVGGAGTATALTKYETSGESVDLYYVSKSKVTEELLPLGSVDPALREDGVDFYIVYDQISGSVTDVFYAEESMEALVGSDFSSFYTNWARSRSDRLKQKDQMLVGWYSGEKAGGGDFEEEIPSEPVIQVTVKNEEELTVTVEYSLPKDCGEGVLSVKLGNTELTGNSSRKRDETTKTVSGGTIYSCTWVLDSLTAGKFKDLNSSVIPGADFTVTAVLTPQDGSSFQAMEDSDGNNSLFQEGSGVASTVYIRCLRHLQNLDTGAYGSGVQGKTEVIQTGNIQCSGNETYGDYDFVPLYNTSLTSFDGRAHKIQGLRVSGTKFSNHAGLFSRMGTGTSNQPELTVSNVRLVNTAINAAPGKYSGALMGEGHEGAKFWNCWVYWEEEGDVTDLRDLLGSDAETYHFQIKGQYAGGLAGYMTGTCEIKNCLAATLVYGEEEAGGLIGHYDGNALRVQNSYADCYLSGGSNSHIAGLIGRLPAGKSVSLESCYAAGYITGEKQGKTAAGFCTGGGTTTAKDVYSAMRYPEWEMTETFNFLTQNWEKDTFQNTHFLGKDSQKVGEIASSSYSEMTSDDFVTAMGGQFVSKTLKDSHPYNLREHLTLSVYSYPGLKNMPHYGDWGAEFKEPSLVYYEEYSGKSWGVSGGNARDLIQQLSDQKTVVSDGYAVAFLQDDLKGSTVEIIYTFYNQEGEEEHSESYQYSADQLTPTSWKNDDGSSADYYMVLLPEELVNSGYAQSCFYRYLKFRLNLGGGEKQSEGEYFFNPHFAETVVPYISEGSLGGWTKAKAEEYAQGLTKNINEIKVRTPRHLYNLSVFPEYYTRQDVFHQILDLDYAEYSGYQGAIMNKAEEQQPIGSVGTPFAGTYNGDCHVIKHVVFSVKEGAKRQYAGLFGYSTGTLRNIVYEMDPEHQVTIYMGNAAARLYVGALAGGSSGLIDNCAVSGVNLRAGAFNVNLYVGGLVGQNEGVIRNCAAESAQLSANCFNYAKIYIGGLVGENAASRSISASYAVGRINAEVDNTITTARICGFVGYNFGSISNSYAAVDLQSSGQNVEAYGFCGVKAGTQSGITGYLNEGNFTFRQSAYSANYHREGDKAAPIRYEALTSGETAQNLGMGRTAEMPDPEKEYPYPAAVRNKEGKYVHYGQWPVPMPLGEMGVYYWEKLVVNGDEAGATYHVSALAVDPGKNTITKQSTLSNAHNDGGVITQYGYGYYSSSEIERNVKLETANITYSQYVPYNNRSNSLPPQETLNEKNMDRSVNDALAALMPGYVFHSWHSYHEGGRGVKGDTAQDPYRKLHVTPGLCPVNPKNDNRSSYPVDPNSGTFTLTQTGTKTVWVEFTVNPQFACAISVNGQSGFTPKLDKGVFQTKPGVMEEHPFEVRCGTQLQELNWYDTAYTDVPLGFGRYNNVARFPYLSDSERTRKFYWAQTHDIDWVAEGNTYVEGGERKAGVFFGIAQDQLIHPASSQKNGTLPGWFGGVYDGGNYTIKNLNIGINEQVYETNCMGLFGVVKNAQLKNIVMYSEEGTDTVTVKGISYDGYDGWYAGGVLAGLALNSQISNCAAAGYTIIDQTSRARINAGTNKPIDMGGAIGGLVGMTDQDLTGCTASTKIIVNCAHNRGNQANSPIRVGGLVGSTSAKVENCYTGGQIVLESNVNAAVYAGRLTGGAGMEPFEKDGTGVTVENCYSFLTLPAQGGMVKETYNIGGKGASPKGNVTLKNNYYLSGTADNKDGERAVNYRQLAGQDQIDSQSIYTKLNGGQSDKKFSPVTSEIGGFPVAGRYSYAPKNRTDLQGLDYPFPTILTQTRETDKMEFHVHYGGWTLNGIERKAGGKPILLDLFTKSTHQETLVLSAGIPTNGTWRPKEDNGAAVKSGNPEIAVGTIPEQAGGGENVLTITATGEGTTTLTVYYTVEENGRQVEYSLSIMVNVTAYTQLRPRAVGVYPNETVTVPLEIWGRDPDRDGADGDVLLLTGGLSAVSAAGSGTVLTAEVHQPAPPDPESGENWTPAQLILHRTEEESEESQLMVNVNYTYANPEEGGWRSTYSGSIAVTLLPLPEHGWKQDGEGQWVWTIAFGEGTTVEKVAGIQEEFIKVEGAQITMRESEKDVELRIRLTHDELNRVLTITVLPPDKAKEKEPGIEPAGEEPVELDA